MHAQIVGADAHALGAVKRHGPKIRRGEAVFFDNLPLGFYEGGGVVGDFHVEDVRRTQQAVGVILQAENRGSVVGLVGAHPSNTPRP